MAESITRDFLDPAVLSRLAGLALDARYPMMGSVSGRHRSPIRGSSLEFAEYRKYVPGDDTRRLDWRAWGRSDRFYIKEFEADTNLRLCFVVDTSGSMNFGRSGATKLDYARRLVGTLAYLAARQGDAVGMFAVGPDFRKEIPPKRNAAHLKLVLDELSQLTATGETGLPTALHQAAEKIRQRALVIVISDFFIEPAILKSCFQHLRYRKHDTVAFHLLDAQEIDFDFDRPVRFLDLEGGPPMLVDPHVIGGRYRHAVESYLADLREVVRGAAVDYHRVQLDDPYEDVLSRFLLARAR